MNEEPLFRADLVEENTPAARQAVELHEDSTLAILGGVFLPSAVNPQQKTLQAPSFLT
jgi:hypothetical protein